MLVSFSCDMVVMVKQGDERKVRYTVVTEDSLALFIFL